MFGRLALGLVFLRFVAQFGNPGLPEQRTAIDIDLAVKRYDVAGLGRDQRIDLDEAGIGFEVQPVHLLDEVTELSHLLFVEVEPEGELAGLVILQPGVRGNGN